MALNISSTTETAVKICGITKIDQALEIASLGADAIGVVGVNNSSRFLEETQRRNLFNQLIHKSPNTERVWVVANIDNQTLYQGLVGYGIPSVVQLHGDESPEKCTELKKKIPNIKFWKALRIHNQDDLISAKEYESSVDAILLDSWNANILGGSGKKVPIELLRNKSFTIPWWLAGGVDSEWIKSALNDIHPYGIDASSKLEISPGIKDITKVKSLLNIVKTKK